MSGGKVWIQFYGIPILIDGAGIVACHVVSQSHPGADHEVERIEFQCLLRFHKGLGMAASDGKVVSIPMVRVGILRIQLQSAPELGLRTAPIPTVGHRKAEGGMGFRRFWIDLDRFACRGISFRECFVRGLKSVPGQAAVAVCQSRIRSRIAGFVVDGLLEILLRLQHALAGSLVPVIAAFPSGTPRVLPD